MPTLTPTTKFTYCFGQVAEGIKTSSFALFLLFYYNQVLGLPGWMCSVALALAMVVDAVTDPMMGSLSDGWKSRLGRRHPFMYISALPLAVCFYAVFNPPESLAISDSSDCVAGVAGCYSRSEFVLHSSRDEDASGVCTWLA